MKVSSKGSFYFAFVVLCATTLIFSVLFLHRLFILPQLGFHSLVSFAERTFSLTAGFLSDLWVSCALILVCILISISKKELVFFSRFVKSCVALSFCLVFVLAAHIPYVDFFHVTFRRVHLPYLYDTEFISSSFRDLFTWRSGVQTTGGIVLTFLFYFAFKMLSFPNAGLYKSEFSHARGKWPFAFNQAFAFCVVCLVGVFSNYLSNKLMRAKDLNFRIVGNTFSSFVLDAVEQQKREIFLSKGLESLNWLEKTYGIKILQNITVKESKSLNHAKERVVAELKNTSLGFDGDFEQQSMDYIRQFLRKEFSIAQLQSKPRYFFVLLLESSRAIDSALLHGEGNGYTPNMDSELKLNGVAFARGYSTGTVSRGGAESTSCNSLASIHYNAMRNTPLAQPVCAAKIFGTLLRNHGVKSTFSWVHGGYWGFDSQGDFWQQHGFAMPINILQQNPKLPRTSFGLTDLAFFDLVETWLQGNELSKPGLHFASIVNATNHTGWVLPTDTPQELKNEVNGYAHRNHQTLRYADFAVGRFFARLKELGIWENSVVVMVGDHGMEDPTGRNGDTVGFSSNPVQNLLAAKKLSHVYFGLSGGLTEQARKKCELESWCSEREFLMKRVVSQADILPTLADILQTSPMGFFGVSLFSSGREFPVVVDLGDHIYLPALSKVTSAEEFLNSSLDFALTENWLAKEETKAKAFYRAYLYTTQKSHFADRWLSAQPLGLSTQ